jgi:CRISPR-associated protein (TIGR03986 family)
MNLSAPFRFVPIPPGQVVQSPVKIDDIRMDRPLPEGSLSGTLNVTWTAKTPICVGEKDSGGRVRPLKVGNRFCLPGSSLRGMLRATVEAATFSHLGRINAWRHHGFRDFEGLKPDHPIAPLSSNPTKLQLKTALRAGWLRFDGRQWLLHPARHHNSLYVLIRISDLVPLLQSSITEAEWLRMSIPDKYRALPKQILNQRIRHVYLPPKPAKNGIPCVAINGQKQVFDSSHFPFKDLVIVCTGPFLPKGQSNENVKKTEALFPRPVDQGVPIPSAWMEIFHRLHSDPARTSGNPRDGWRDWLRAYGWEASFSGFKQDRNDVDLRFMANPDLGIPIFWKGDLDKIGAAKDPAESGFWLSLSRVMRAPYKMSVGDAAKNLYKNSPFRSPSDRPYQSPSLKECLDFGRSLFGDVESDQGDASLPNPKQRAAALRGRVSVGFAYAPEDAKCEDTPQVGVFGRPRESFWPFYLRTKSDDKKTSSFNNQDAIPAGRKRTIVRKQVTHGGWTIPDPSSDGSNSSTLYFLERGTQFHGQIRFHNLHPAELGALLWALTYGDVSGSHWHVLGRAKAFGYGALKPSVAFAAPPRVVGSEKAVTSLEYWLALFRAYMTKALSNFGFEGEYEQHPSIIALKNASKPSDSPEAVYGSLKNYTDYWEAVRSFDDGNVIAGITSTTYPLPDS